MGVEVELYNRGGVCIGVNAERRARAGVLLPHGVCTREVNDRALDFRITHVRPAHTGHCGIVQDFLGMKIRR